MFRTGYEKKDQHPALYISAELTSEIFLFTKTVAVKAIKNNHHNPYQDH
jgi:hypothetical protein